MTFRDGVTTLGTATLSSGKATLTTSTLAAANHSITVVYSGDTHFTGGTSATLTQAVARAATTTAVVSSQNPSISGQLVTFTATVTATAPGTGIPAGTVSFKDGSTVIGTGTLNGSGQATFGTSTLTVGSHSITVVYSGNASYKTSTSAVLTQVVNAAESPNFLAVGSTFPIAAFAPVTTNAGSAAIADAAGSWRSHFQFLDQMSLGAAGFHGTLSGEHALLRKSGSIQPVDQLAVADLFFAALRTVQDQPDR